MSEKQKRFIITTLKDDGYSRELKSDVISCGAEENVPASVLHHFDVSATKLSASFLGNVMSEQ